MEPRRSLRQRGVASDGVSVVEELRGGAVTTNILLPAEPAKPKERHPKGAAAGCAACAQPHLAAMLHYRSALVWQHCTAAFPGARTEHTRWRAHDCVLEKQRLTCPDACAHAGEVALEDSDGAGPDAAFLSELRARAVGSAEQPSVQQVAKWRCGEDDIAKVRGLIAQRMVASASAG